MDRATTPIGQALAGISGIALILIMLLFAWFSVPQGGGGLDAFKSFHDWVLLVLLLTAFAAMAVGLMGSEPLGLPVALSAITTALGVISVVILFIYLISPPGLPFGEVRDVDLDRDIGIWLGLIATAGIAGGGYLSMQEEGITFADQADGLRGGDGPTAGTPQSAPRPQPAQPPRSTPPPPQPTQPSPPESTPPPPQSTPPPSTPPPGAGT
jgi:hypothetical protein